MKAKVRQLSLASSKGIQGHYVQIAGVSTCPDILFVVAVDVPGIELMASHMLGTYSTSDLDPLIKL